MVHKVVYIYLNLKDEIVASKSKSNDSKSIQSRKSPFQLSWRFYRIIRDVGQSSLDEGDHPNQSAVADCGDGSDQRHASYGVQVWELSQEDSDASEHQVPLNGSQGIGVAISSAYNLEECL